MLLRVALGDTARTHFGIATSPTTRPILMMLVLIPATFYSRRRSIPAGMAVAIMAVLFPSESESAPKLSISRVGQRLWEVRLGAA